MYQVEVPQGVYPGVQFQTVLNGEMMLVTCPEGAGPGATIQVAGPASSSVPTVTGIPVGPGVAPTPAVGSAYPGGAYPGGAYAGGAYAAGAYAGDGGVTVVQMQPHVEMVEVDEISPAGWFCLIVGCFACPGLNLLGLCMRERRLVPVAHYHTMA